MRPAPAPPRTAAANDGVRADPDAWVADCVTVMVTVETPDVVGDGGVDDELEDEDEVVEFVGEDEVVEDVVGDVVETEDVEVLVVAVVVLDLDEVELEEVV
jgi:hypothetical protein